MTATQIFPGRLSKPTSLARGAHEANVDGMWCAMEAAAYIAGEP